MPTARKRIGFLPRKEVQFIIDKISKDNKLSQSKVTGILVEEALNARGVLDSIIEVNKSNYILKKKDKNNISDNDLLSINNDLTSVDERLKEDFKMINDYIEYKYFKKIMSEHKNND